MLNGFLPQTRQAGSSRLALGPLAVILCAFSTASFAQISPGVPPAVNDGYYAPMIIQQQTPAQPAWSGSGAASAGPDNPPANAAMPSQATGAPAQTIMVPITVVPQAQTQQSAQPNPAQ